MAPSRVLLAGGSGAIGSELLRLLASENHFVRSLSRTESRAAALRGVANEVVVGDATRAETLTPALFEGIDVVVSCLGANVSLGLRERRGYGAVDVAANANLLEGAKRAGVRRFVYLSAHPAPGYDQTRYVRAHLEVEERLRASGLSCSFVRPTGVFTAFDDFLSMARSGFASIPGSGQATSNPIHPLDVAEALRDVLLEGPQELSVGGPDVLTRAEMVRLAFEVVGNRPRLVHVPRGIFGAMSVLLRPFHPRLSELIEFLSAVTSVDCVAPVRGRRTLRDWYAERLRAQA